MALNDGLEDQAPLDHQDRLGAQVSTSERLWHEETNSEGCQIAEAVTAVTRCHIESYDGYGQGS
jgi:hypothetical protein